MALRRLTALGLGLTLALTTVASTAAQNDGFRERVTGGLPNIEFPGATVIGEEPVTPEDLARINEFLKRFGH